MHYRGQVGIRTRKSNFPNRVVVPSENLPPIRALYDYRFRKISQKTRDAAWRVIAEDIYQRLGNPAVVLDIAAGRGEFLRFCAAHEKWAIDLACHTWIEANGVKLVQGNALEVDLATGYFDAVFICNFLEHLNDPEEILRLLKRVHGSLKKEGVIGILGPNFKYAFREYYDFSDHKCPLTEQSVDELLHLAGFRSETLFPKYLPFSFQSHLPTWPWLIKAYIRLPLLWRLFGKQFLVVARKA